MAKKDRVFIIGGGIIGLLSAYRLIQLGYPVTLFDRGNVGQEASWAGGGILSPLYPWQETDAINELVAQSQSIYPGLCERLHKRTRIDPQWVVSGMIVIDQKETAKAVEWSQKSSISLEIIGNDEVNAVQAGLSFDAEEAICLPQVAQLRNPRLIAALKAELLLSGCEIHQKEPIVSISCSNNRFVGLQSASASYSGRHCLVAAGAWSTQLTKPLGFDLAVRPILGQMLLLRLKPGVLKRIIVSDHYYLIPRLDGHVLLGSTVEDCGFNKQITAEAKALLLEKGIALFPPLKDANIVTQWAGLRPARSSPYIGVHPGCEGLYICAGHFRNGLVTAPASAIQVIDLLIKGEQY